MTVICVLQSIKTHSIVLSFFEQNYRENIVGGRMWKY